MKSPVSLKDALNLIHPRINIIVYTLIIVIFCLLLFFIYQNLYLTLVAPQDIGQSEITAKRQKVNTELLNAITEEISLKKDASVQELLIIDDPFID